MRLLNTIRDFFVRPSRPPLTRMRVAPGLMQAIGPYIIKKENNMGAFVNNKPEIIETDGNFALIDGEGNLVSTYVRRRDAVRGAERRGLNI